MKTKPSYRLLAGSASFSISVALALGAASCREATETGAVDLSSTTEDLAGSSSQDLSGSASTDLATGPVDMVPPPEPTEFMVVRVGAGGTTALTGAAAAVFVERHKIDNGALVGSPIALPTVENGTTKRLTVSGSSQSEGLLSRSANGAYVLLAGYDADPGTGSISSSAPGTVKRVIARIGADNSVDTTTAFAGLTGAVRGATSTDGKMLWASGLNGAYYTTYGSTADPTKVQGGNLRGIEIIGGQLYASTGSTTDAGGINTVGSGTPTTAGATLTQLPGFAAQMALSSYGFAAMDRDSTPGLDTLYVADDRTTNGGVQRWRLRGTTWTLDGTFSVGATVGARAVAAFVSGANVALLAVIPESGATTARVVSFVDNGQNPSLAPAKLLATAEANTTYRGLCLPPQ